jgi:autotransporter-associated beta strand protein
MSVTTPRILRLISRWGGLCRKWCRALPFGSPAGDRFALGSGSPDDDSGASQAPAIPGKDRLLARLGPILLGALLALLAAALTPAPTLAATKTWSGTGGDANWSTPGNWQGLIPPFAGDDLVFPAVASKFTNNNNLPAGTSFRSITISGSGYTLDGNSIVIADNQTITASYASGTSTINFSVSANFPTVNVTNMGATLVFGGNFSGSTYFNKNGTGAAVLLGTTTSGGGWLVNAGILNIQNGGALGTGGTSVEVGGTLQLQGGITVPALINLRGIGAANATGALESVSGNNTLTGLVILFADATASVDVGSTVTSSGNQVALQGFTLRFQVAGTATISSVVVGGVGTGAGGLTKTGAGPLTLSGNNTYTGPTTLFAGTLLVNGSQPASNVTVNNGATLGGTGVIGLLTTNGIVSPGVGGPGVLSSNSATFNSPSTFAVDLNGTTVGTGYDQLAASGAVTLTAPTLNVSVGFPSATGNTFTIARAFSALSGTFAGLPEGATLTSGGRTLRINYTATTATLTDVTPTRILGDINSDGFVDIRDYGLWRQSFGATDCGNIADLDGNCLVDIRDYGIWRQHFGEGTPPDRRGETHRPG